MTWHRHEGLWVLGTPLTLPAPLIQVVEGRGAVLEWAADAEPTAVPVLTVVDTAEADWLWQLIGEPAHAALLTGSAAEPRWRPELLVALRRIAHGLWLRTWWPASPHDGIPELRRDLLDAELSRLCAELDDIVDDERLPRWAAVPVPTRAEFALAAHGTRDDSDEPRIATGSATLAWQGVPTGIFDATEHPVSWAVDAAPEPELHVRVRLLPEAAAGLVEGIEVAAELPPHDTATGALDARGEARLRLPLTASEAWGQDWAALRLRVGRAVAESAGTRRRVRALARARGEAADALSFAAEASDDF